MFLNKPERNAGGPCGRTVAVWGSNGGGRGRDCGGVLRSSSEGLQVAGSSISGPGLEQEGCRLLSL